MANFYSDIATAQNNALTKFGDHNQDGGLVSGELRTARATYELLGTEAATDFIYLCKLPKGARVRPDLCRIVCADPGTTLVVNIGDLADADRYASAVDISAGGSFAFDELTTAPLADYQVGDTAADTGWIVLDPTSVSTLTADAKIVVEIVYSTAG